MLHHAALPHFERLGKCHDGRSRPAGIDRKDAQIVRYHSRKNSSRAGLAVVGDRNGSTVSGRRIGRQQRADLRRRGVVHQRVHSSSIDRDLHGGATKTGCLKRRRSNRGGRGTQSGALDNEIPPGAIAPLGMRGSMLLAAHIACRFVSSLAPPRLLVIASNSGPDFGIARPRRGVSKRLFQHGRDRRRCERP